MFELIVEEESDLPPHCSDAFDNCRDDCENALNIFVKANVGHYEHWQLQKHNEDPRKLGQRSAYECSSSVVSLEEPIPQRSYRPRNL